MSHNGTIRFDFSDISKYASIPLYIGASAIFTPTFIYIQSDLPPLFSAAYENLYIKIPFTPSPFTVSHRFIHRLYRVKGHHAPRPPGYHTSVPGSAGLSSVKPGRLRAKDASSEEPRCGLADVKARYMEITTHPAG